MAKSTFSGPVKSLAGFISAGNAVVVSLTADTSLTVASHAGKILTCNDADGKFTLPSIVAYEGSLFCLSFIVSSSYFTHSFQMLTDAAEPNRRDKVLRGILSNTGEPLTGGS